MKERLINEYVNRMTIEDVNKFALQNGIILKDEELNEYKSKYPLCYKEDEDKLISNCYYYFDDKNDSDTSNDTTLIDVGFLADDSTNDAYLEYDDKDNRNISVFPIMVLAYIIYCLYFGKELAKAFMVEPVNQP